MPDRLARPPLATRARQFGLGFVSRAAARAPGAVRGPTRASPSGTRVFRENRAPVSSTRTPERSPTRADLIPPSIFSSSADPLDHVFWTGVGATAANLNAEWEAKLRKEVAELNKERSATNASFMESILKEK